MHIMWDGHSVICHVLFPLTRFISEEQRLFDTEPACAIESNEVRGLPDVLSKLVLYK